MLCIDAIVTCRWGFATSWLLHDHLVTVACFFKMNMLQVLYPSWDPSSTVAVLWMKWWNGWYLRTTAFIALPARKQQMVFGPLQIVLAIFWNVFFHRFYHWPVPFNLWMGQIYGVIFGGPNMQIQYLAGSSFDVCSFKFCSTTAKSHNSSCIPHRHKWGLPLFVWHTKETKKTPGSCKSHSYLKIDFVWT